MMHSHIKPLPEPAVGERRMWCAVLAAVIEDYRKEYAAAVKRDAKGVHKHPLPGNILKDVQAYFVSRDGRFVCANAGFDDLSINLVLRRVKGEGEAGNASVGRWNGGHERFSPGRRVSTA